MFVPLIARQRVLGEPPGPVATPERRKGEGDRRDREGERVLSAD